MKRPNQIAAELVQEARANGLRLRFDKQGRNWVATWEVGRQTQLWCGTLRDTRRISGGR